MNAKKTKKHANPPTEWRTYEVVLDVTVAADSMHAAHRGVGRMHSTHTQHIAPGRPESDAPRFARLAEEGNIGVTVNGIVSCRFIGITTFE